jgi:RimJ/RimL family protein N-acetyltransferase
MIRYVTDADLERVRVFLEAHVETSLFLLSNLAVLGPRLGEHFNSGNYKMVEESGEVLAVFCLTRRGNLLVQAGGRTGLAEPILAACEGQPIGVRGVIGEWPTAEALWHLLRADPRFEPTLSAKDVLYRLRLSAALGDALQAPSPMIKSRLTALLMTGPERRDFRSPAPGIAVRVLEPADFEQWEPLNTAYLTELHLPVPTPDEQRKAEFVSRSRAHLWWGAFDGLRLLTTVGLNATYGSLGQVGGVYTPPEERRKGLASRAMRLLIEECRDYHRFEKLILFTGEDNRGARRLYESLGFESGGAFGLLLGSRRTRK